MSLRYLAGRNLLGMCHLLGRIASIFRGRLASIFENLAMIVWTPREIDQYSKTGWNSWEKVGRYYELDDWLDLTERALVEKYLTNDGELLNLACGAGREARLLGRRGLRVTAFDWSPRMIAAAQSRAQESNLPIRFEVADLYNFQYPENAFDYVLLTNLGYSCFFPRKRRVHLLRQAYSALKPGGLFIVSFITGGEKPYGRLQSALVRLRKYPPFNREYEPNDSIVGGFLHSFQPGALKSEFEEAQFDIKEWLWDTGYAVLVKLEEEACNTDLPEKYSEKPQTRSNG